MCFGYSIKWLWYEPDIGAEISYSNNLAGSGSAECNTPLA